MSSRHPRRHKPHVVPNLHVDDCPIYRDVQLHDKGTLTYKCQGCLPCTRPHCPVCGGDYAALQLTHPECIAEVRDDLGAIGRLCGLLPAEALRCGVNSEAFNLYAPAADWEARYHLEQSIAAGRVPAHYLEAEPGDERHPYVVLTAWESAYRQGLGHADTQRQTISGAVAYLSDHLTEASSVTFVDFGEFADGLYTCRTHLEGVVHAGEQVERGARCAEDGERLVRVWGHDEHEDGWECPKCSARLTVDEHADALLDEHIRTAAWLTADHMAERTGARRGTVVEWARRGHVRKRTDPNTGRMTYAVADVEARLGVG